MSRFAETNKLMPIVSRLITRGARARAGIGGAGSRVIAAVAVLAILVAAHASVRPDRDASAETFRSFSAVTSFEALHVAPGHRLALDSRSPTPWSAGSDVPLPEHAPHAFSETVQHRIAIAAAIGHGGQPAVARGYDATAPPPLS